MLKFTSGIIKFVSICSLLLFASLPLVNLEPLYAQGFSASSADSYYCVGGEDPAYNDVTQRFECASGSAALIRPPKLRQVEVWFVTLVYAAWGLSGIVFTFSLIVIGFRYLTSQGNPEQIGKLKTRLGQWAIGFVLVFLAYPILSTVFSFIGLNPCLTEEIELPGFQFFFEEAIDPDAECEVPPTP